MHFLKTLKLESTTALRYLQSRNKEKFISINSVFSLVGIALGVAALVVVMSIMNGFHEELSSKIIGLNSDVIITGYKNSPIKNYQEIVSKVNKLDEVRATFPAIQKQGLIVNNSKSAGVIVKSIQQNSLKDQTLINQNLSQKTIASFKKNEIILGISVANRLRVKIGDQVSLMSPEFHTSFFGKMPKIKTFVVTGLFNTGLTEYDDTVVFIPLQTGQIFYGLENSVNQLEVFSYNHSQAPLLALYINHILEGNFRVVDWQQINASLFNALKTERVAMFTILTLIIIVAAFNIVSSLTMLVIDKSKEIAILKTIGMSKGSIIRIFFFCGFIISFFATILGLGMGLAIAYNIQDIKEFLSTITQTNLFDPVVYYLDTLPSKVDLQDLKLITILVASLTAIATYYPARKAGNLSPVDVLKSE